MFKAQLNARLYCFDGNVKTLEYISYFMHTFSPPAGQVDKSACGEVRSVGRLHKVGPRLLRRPGVGISVDCAGVTEINC